MTDAVKAPGPHVALLLGAAFERIRGATEGPRWRGLRQSHLRIIDTVAPEGSRSVELARRLRMTKQGAGQLVATLLRLGLVDQVPDPVDRRARLLVLTDEGRALRRALEDELAAIEAAWSSAVGAEDYATFRRVLLAIADQPVARA